MDKKGNVWKWIEMSNALKAPFILGLQNIKKQQSKLVFYTLFRKPTEHFLSLETTHLNGLGMGIVHNL